MTSLQIDLLLASLQDLHAEQPGLEEAWDPTRRGAVEAGFRRFLERFPQEEPNQHETARELAETALAAHIPFILIMAAFNHLKKRVVEQIAANTSDPLAHYQDIDNRFERSKRWVAHCYLRHATAHPPPFPEKMVRGRYLIQFYRDWLERLNRALHGNDLAAYPFINPRSDPFIQGLRHPESMFICLDLKFCDQLQEQHRIIQQQAALLHALAAGGRYDQAYLAHQELERRVFELLNLLSALYLESQTNRIHRFFHFLQATLYLPGRKTLAVINLRGLRQINNLQGSEAGDRLLNLVEERLRSLCHHHRKHLLYIPGIAGDFYLLGYDLAPQTMGEFLGTLLRDDRQALPTPELTYAGLELTDLHQLTEDNIPFLVDYLTEQARHKQGEILTRERATPLVLDWLRRRYRSTVDLHTKLQAGAVDIHIQPLVSLKDQHHIHAFEVLGRITGPEGELNAGIFIDDIVRLGLVTQFDRLVLNAVIRHADDLGHITQRLFINVSADSLTDEDYLRALHRALTGPLKGLEVVLELTEQVMMERLSHIHDLHHRYGFRFAIDDFGTGYSSLQTVIQSALEGSVRYLKLDGSLTRHLHDHPANARIMHITQQMARELGLETVVEFIETHEQLHTLQDLTMDLGQGFLLGIPDPVPVWRGKLAYLSSRNGRNGTDGFAL